jgi:predicted TIM-barrel fold metal-dependent hydrolase
VSKDEWLISVDDHVIEPPALWVERLPAKYRDIGPRWVTSEEAEGWLFEESTRVPVGANVTNGAIWPEENRADTFAVLRWSEVPVACYDPAARVEAMNQHRELAALCFSNMGGFCGSLFQRARDKKLSLLCIQAYNDWFLEEWCDAYPGRFIGLALIPMWDGELAAAEAERAVGKGARGVSFSQAPHNIGFPKITEDHWEPLFSVMNDCGLPLCTHLGTGIGAMDVAGSTDQKNATGDQAELAEMVKNNDVSKLAERMGISEETYRRRSKLLPGASTSLLGARMGSDTLNSWLESGNFDRYPNLKLALSENGVGWIPSVLSLADWIETMYRDAEAAVGPAARTPSDVFREHVYGCFVHEPITETLLDELGEDNIMIECDFPHTATNGPHSMERAQECLGNLSEEVRHKILRGNAERVFQFVPAKPPVIVG